MSVFSQIDGAEPSLTLAPKSPSKADGSSKVGSSKVGGFSESGRGLGRWLPRSGRKALRLRTLLALSFGILSISIIAIVVTVMKYEADRQMTLVVHRELHQVSEQASDRVAKWLYERAADLKLMSGILSQPGPPAIRRYAIEKVREIYPLSTAWLAHVDENCKVIAATDKLFEGETLTNEVCEGPTDRLLVGRVVWDDRYPKIPVTEPRRPATAQDHYYLPMSYPITTAEGKFVGRVFMMVRTSYIDGLLTTVPYAVSDGQPARTFIVSRNTGRVIVGGDCAGTAVSDTFMDDVGRIDPEADLDWPDGKGFLSASYPSKAFREVPDLNWVMVSRAHRGGALYLVNEQAERILKWGIGLSLGSILLALVLAKSIGRPLEALTMFATNTLARERAVAEASNGRYREISELAEALEERFLEITQARDHTAAALVDREALLKEVHHRVKNNLQVIISLMRLQGSRIKDNPDGREVVERLTSRVQVIGWLYSTLYERAIFSKISAKSFLEPLVSVIQDTYQSGARVSVDIDICELKLSFDQTLVLGMLVIEVVTNAMQHAYVRHTGLCPLTIRLKDIGDHKYVLVVTDSGGGFDTSKRHNGIGLTMAGRMAVQLGDPMDIRSDPTGTTVRITFRSQPDENDGPLPTVSA